jgi:glycosyltransferase involved in cell wall biosynthesis
MANNPRVSVVMAVHNGQAYLKEAVDSILRQSFSAFEFIIVDDGSTDRSGEILDACAAADSRIRVIKQENMGLTRSLNRGLSLSRGEFIARMDADDVSLPNRFQLQVNFFETHPDHVLLGAEVLEISPEGDPLCFGGRATDHVEIRRRMLLGGGDAVSHPVVMIRKTALDQVGSYDEAFQTTQDLDLFLRLSEVGQVANLPQHLLLWRQHPASVNKTKFATWPLLKRLAVQKAIDRVGLSRYLADIFPEGAMPPEKDWPLFWDALAANGGWPKTGFKRGLRRVWKGPHRITGIRNIFRSVFFLLDRLVSRLSRIVDRR